MVPYGKMIRRREEEPSSVCILCLIGIYAAKALTGSDLYVDTHVSLFILLT